MSFASKDQAAAIADLIAFDGETIEIGGKKIRAHIEREATTAEASEFGLDNREKILSATIVTTSFDPQISAPALYRGERFRVSGIDPQGDRVATLTLTNDQ